MQQILRRVMWGSGVLAVLAVLVCIVLSNFFFPAADQADQFIPPEQQSDSTFFHPEDTAAIRAWKISLSVFGASVGIVMLAAFIHGLLYPPQELPSPPPQES